MRIVVMITTMKMMTMAIRHRLRYHPCWCCWHCLPDFCLTRARSFHSPDVRPLARVVLQLLSAKVTEKQGITTRLTQLIMASEKQRDAKLNEIMKKMSTDMSLGDGSGARQDSKRLGRAGAAGTAERSYRR